MNLIRCRKCGAAVVTETTIEESLMAEKQEIINRYEQAQRERLASYSPKHRKQLGTEMGAIQYRIGEINKQLKQFKHLSHKESRDRVNEVFIELLMGELYALGVTKQKVKELGGLARTKYEMETKQARYERERLYADAGRESKHNEWHGVSGQYDPTAKTAIDNTRGW